jgi:hypothetical protein
MSIHNVNIAKMFSRDNINDIRHPHDGRLRLGSHLPVGTYVLTVRGKHTFEKGYKPNWNKTPHRIAVVKNTVPVTYLLHTMAGRAEPYSYYREELKKITKLEAESLGVKTVKVVERRPES